MIPILYDSIVEGQIPNHFGLGSLTDTISAKCTEERNGAYEIVFEYASSGIHAEEILPNRFIKAKPNFTDAPQIFRIYKVGKEMNGKFTCYCEHISYDLGGKILPSNLVVFGSSAAVQKITEEGGGNFNITTNIVSTRMFKTDVPSSTRSWFGGKEGSLLDLYGGEWKYDNYTCSLLASRGTDRGVQIRYGKNLTQLSQEIDMTNLVTGVYGYATNSSNNTTTMGSRIATGLVLDVPHDIAVDFSNDVDWNSDTPIATQLNTLATRYISNNSASLIRMNDSITLDFVQMKELSDRVDLCDTVHIFFEALGINVSMKCIKTEWDVLEERYTSATFGEARTSIADTISVQTKKLETVPTVSQLTTTISNATQLITGNLGGYVVLHDSDNDGYPDEILVMNTDDIATATEVWRWNKNGLAYGTSYEGPFNTLALTSDGKIVADAITTGTLSADRIKAGILSDVNGNSSINMTNGVAKLSNLKAISSFDLVETDDTIYASMGHSRPSQAYIKLVDYARLEGSSASSFLLLKNANVGYGISEIEADATNNVSFIKLKSGGSSFVGLNASCDNLGGSLKLTKLNGTGIAYLIPDSYGGRLELKNSSGNNHILLYGSSTGGQLTLYNGSNTPVLLQSSSDGGNLYIKNASGNVVAQFNVGSGNKDGIMYLFKSDHTPTIWALGHTGNITCVSLTQTSSRKTKENIRPIEDSEKILDLQAVAFDFKDKDRGTDKRGFIAEDVKEILPNLVTNDETPSLNYVEMIPYLQDVIKKQEARIKALEEKLYGSN